MPMVGCGCMGEQRGHVRLRRVTRSRWFCEAMQVRQLGAMMIQLDETPRWRSLTKRYGRVALDEQPMYANTLRSVRNYGRD